MLPLRLGAAAALARHRALGLDGERLARTAVAGHRPALDGGISSQLLVRDAGGGERAWRGWRKVPMGVVFEER